MISNCLSKSTVITLLILSIYSCGIFGRKIFTSQWYDYYERGQDFIDRELYTLASKDFREAIKLRSKDKRWAQTYGMHYLSYFPHRELGFVLYLMGNYDEAKLELEISISQEPSDKANKYLDKVRGKLLLQKLKKHYPHMSLQQLMPEIVIKNDHIHTNSTAIISGLVKISPHFQDINKSDLYYNNYIKHITINSKTYFIDVSKPEIEFSDELHLAEGTHEITITADDILGYTKTKIVYITVDKTGPVISKLVYLPNILIKGIVKDISGGIKLTIDGTDVPIPDGINIPFSIPLNGNQNHTIIAKDRLGNRTFAILNKNKFSNMYVYNDRAIVMSDALNPQFSDSKANIEIYGHDEKNSVTVYKDEIEITGEISGFVNIKSLEINNQLLFRDKGNYFGCLMSLNQGENIIELTATTDQDVQYTKNYIVNREIFDIFSTEKRYTIEIMKFKNFNDSDNDNMDLFHGYLIQSFANKQRFNIVDKDSKNTEKKSQALICGTYKENKYGIEVEAWFKEMNSNEIIFLKDVYAMDKTSHSIKLSAERLSEKIHKELPIITGTVVTKINDNSFWGSPNNKMSFLIPDLYIYRKIESHRNTVTGASWGYQYQTIGPAELIEIKNEKIKANHKVNVPVEKKDLFINQ